MILEIRNADVVNAILNHPEVRNTVAQLWRGRLDVTDIVSDTRNVVLGDPNYGVGLAKWLAAGVYGIHAAILPEGRGKWARDASREGLRWLFTRTDARILRLRLPSQHHAAKGLARMVGFRFSEHSDEIYELAGRSMPIEIWRCSREEWLTRVNHA